MRQTSIKQPVALFDWYFAFGRQVVPAAMLTIVMGMTLNGQALLGQQMNWESTPTSTPTSPPSEVRIELPKFDEVNRAGSVQPLALPGGSSYVRVADFQDPIPGIPDVAPSSEGLIGTIQQRAQANVNGLMGALPAAQGMGSRIQETFASVNLQKIFGSLAIVLGAYFGLVWVTRRLNGGRVGGLPREVVEVLGNAPFGPKKNLQLVRLGSKLLLLLHSPDGTTTIGEINDRSEVEYLSGVCTGKPARRDPPVHKAPAPPVVAPATPAVYAPEVTLPVQALENVVRRMAAAAEQNGVAPQNGANVFEA